MRGVPPAESRKVVSRLTRRAGRESARCGSTLGRRPASMSASSLADRAEEQRTEDAVARPRAAPPPRPPARCWVFFFSQRGNPVDEETETQQKPDLHRAVSRPITVSGNVRNHNGAGTGRRNCLRRCGILLHAPMVQATNSRIAPARTSGTLRRSGAASSTIASRSRVHDARDRACARRCARVSRSARDGPVDG